MRINERAQIFFYFLSHFLLTISLTSMLQKKPVQNVGFVVFFTICVLTAD